MLGFSCRIHLGIQWLRIWCFKSYAQNQLGRLQDLCPTLPTLSFHVLQSFILNTKVFITSCVPELLIQHKYKHSCAPEVLAQHKYKHSCAPKLLTQQKHQIPICSRSPRSTQNISSIMHFRAHAQNTKSYIKHIPFFLRPIYQTNHHVHVQWGLRPNIQIKTSK